MAHSTPSPLPAVKDTANLKGWSGYGTQIFLTRKPPVMGTVVLDELEELMRKKFEHAPGPFTFLTGNAGTGATYAANRRAFQRWKIVPRMLRNVTQRDLSISLFGSLKLPMPVIISPIGCQGIWHEDGELGTARAASKLGIPFTMSTVASRTITQVAAASGAGPRWFQLYWPQINDLTASILSRVEAAGFDVLLLTLDTMHLGWRPKDLSEAFLPMVHGYSSAVATEDPVFMKQWHGLEPMIDNAPFPYEPKVIDSGFLAGEPVIKRRVDLSLDWLKQVNNGVFRDWSDIAFVRHAWKKPLLLKGIQSVQDALLALDAGVDGIVVSNHGGRQLDGAIASLTALAGICANPRIRQAQHEGKFTVLFDSGIRTGSDIVKAVALGAQAVLVGRPWVYGLALAGEAGVDAVMRSLFADLEISLALAGYRNFAEIWDKRDEVLVQDDT